MKMRSENGFTYNPGSTSCDGKPTKEEGSPDDAHENYSSGGTLISPVECIVNYLCWYKAPTCLIVWVV